MDLLKYFDKDVKNRATVLPVAEKNDGSFILAVPQAGKDVVEGFQGLLNAFGGEPFTTESIAEDTLNTMAGSSLIGAKPVGALGMGALRTSGKKMRKLSLDEWEKAKPEERMKIAQENAYIKWPELGPDNTPEQRAAKMGFNVDEPVYHYSRYTDPSDTGKNFQEFKVQNRVGVPKQDILGTHVGTDEAARQRFFTEMTGKLPSEMRARNDDWAPLERYPSFDEETKGQTLKLLRREGDQFTGTNSEPWSETELQDFLEMGNHGQNLALREELAKRGKVSLPYINAEEDLDSLSHIMFTDRSEGSPAVLRSFNAAFDPAQADSAKLLAAKGAPVTIPEEPTKVLPKSMYFHPVLGWQELDAI